jgi:hypothetical protein
MKAYQNIPLKEQSFLQKLFKQQPPENSIIELNNLLARKEIKEISSQNVVEISSRYRCDFLQKYQKNVLEFYAVLLNSYLAEYKLDNAKIEDLKHLQKILKLSDFQSDNIHDQLTGKIYENYYRDLISDGRLTDEKEQKLERLKKDIVLSDKQETQISDFVRKEYMNNFVQSIVADERLSPDELAELDAVAKSLKIDIQIDKETERIMKKYKLFWKIENEEIPTIDVDVSLQKSEVCYFSEYASWFEYRTVTHRVNYAGPTARIKIVKGVYYRVGSIKASPVKSEELKLIKSGRLYLTNKRIIFVGDSKNSTININKILSFTPYSDGISIEKDTGKSPTITFNNVETFCLMLSRLMREN